MAKIITILLVALVFEAVGVVFLSRGLKQIGAVQRLTLPEVCRVVGRGATHPLVLLGVFFEALFFAGLLILLARADVSLIWPLTSLGLVLTTLAARILGQEQVTHLRWSGVLLIVIGAVLFGWSEQQASRSGLLNPILKVKSPEPTPD